MHTALSSNHISFRYLVTSVSGIAARAARVGDVVHEPAYRGERAAWDILDAAGNPGRLEARFVGRAAPRAAPPAALPAAR